MSEEEKTLDQMEGDDFGTPVLETEEPVAVEDAPVVEETPVVEDAPVVEELTELEQLRADNARMKLDHEDLLSRFDQSQTPPEEPPPEPAPTEAAPMFTDEEFEAAMVGRDGMEILAGKISERAQAQSIEQMNQIVPQLIAQGMAQEMHRMQVAQKTEQFFLDNPELRAEAKRVDLIANQVLKENPDLANEDPNKFMTTVRDESYKRLGIRRSTEPAPPAPRGAHTRRVVTPVDPLRAELDELDNV